MIRAELLEKVFEFLAEKANDYVVAMKTLAEDKHEPFNLQNWMKIESNYPKLFQTIESKIEFTSFAKV